MVVIIVVGLLSECLFLAFLSVNKSIAVSALSALCTPIRNHSIAES